MEPSEVLSGRYRVGRLLGAGGMADVHEGEDLRLQRPVALKILRPELGHDLDVRRRFEAEARWAANLSHPNIVAVYDVGEDAEQAYLVMELLPGRTLADRIRTGPLPEPEAVGVIRQVLAALASAHAAGVLHRDIKPANILLATDGTAKVVDFGIAKALDPQGGPTDQTAVNLVVGTPSYVAPERMQGEPASVASDLWAVGAVLYEALTGDRPFTGDNPVAVALAAQQARMVPVRERRPDLTPATASVVERALRPEPSARFASASAMSDALEAATGATVAMAAPLAAGDSTVAMSRTAAMAPPTTVGEALPPPPPPVPPPPRRRITGRQAAIIAVAMLLVAGLIAAGILAASSNKTPAPTTTTTTSPSSSTTTSPSTTAAPSTTVATTTTTIASSTTTTAAATTTSTSTVPPTTAPPTSVTVGVP